ncbi:MAG: OmpA family protein [Sphingobacteriaceae bacterium]|nr:OmpA family protein [Sphingobacteriaceae bacterium]
MAKNEKELYAFVMKKMREDSIAGIKTFVTLSKDSLGKDKVGIFPKIDKDDKYRNINNVYAFNEKDSTVTYKVHIGVSPDKLEPNDHASVVSSFSKDILLQNPNLRYQFLMMRDTIRKGYVRPGKNPAVTTNTTVATNTAVATNTTVATTTTVPTKTTAVVSNTVEKDPNTITDPPDNADTRISYRIQIGAYRLPKPKNAFDALWGTVTEVLTDDGWYKYATDNVVSLENAMDLQIALESMGYSNAFITAYKGKRRITIVESVFDGFCVYFDLDKFNIRPNEQEKIDFYFKNYTNKIIKEVELEGNTCNLGTAEYNFKLSERRVLSVEKALEPYVKVKIKRKFLGEFYPLYNNSPEDIRRLNRRVDVLILN